MRTTPEAIVANSTYGKFAAGPAEYDPGKDRIWRTADGRECPVSRMSTAHILNALQLIKFSFPKWRLSFYVRLKHELNVRGRRPNHGEPAGDSRCNAGRPSAREGWERM